MNHPRPHPSKPARALVEFVRLGSASVALLDRGMNYLAVSASWSNAFGRGHTDLVGLNHYEVHTDIPEAWKAVHRASLSGGTVRREDEERWVRSDGTEQWLRWTVMPWRDESEEIGGILISAEDVTAERALRDSQAWVRSLLERLASAVESIHEAFALFDETDRLVLCNGVYRRLVGDGIEGPILGLPYETVLDAWLRDTPFENDAARESFRAQRLARRRDEPRTSLDLRIRDGRTLRVIERRTADGGSVVMVRDLTEDVRLTNELLTAQIAADAANRAKTEFLASVTHELRTPLNAILGFAQLLQRDRKEPLSPRHRERAEQIVQGGEHLLHLVEDILDLASIDAGRVSTTTEQVSVVEALRK